jgi:hypothetical protein
MYVDLYDIGSQHPHDIDKSISYSGDEIANPYVIRTLVQL